MKKKMLDDILFVNIYINNSIFNLREVRDNLHELLHSEVKLSY